jgi:hypothetical protein
MERRHAQRLQSASRSTLVDSFDRRTGEESIDTAIQLLITCSTAEPYPRCLSPCFGIPRCWLSPGYDPGALVMAKRIGGKARWLPGSVQVSRLLVDLNRSWQSVFMAKRSGNVRPAAV